MNPAILRDPSEPLPVFGPAVYLDAYNRASLNAWDASQTGAYSLARSYRQCAEENRRLAVIAEGIGRREVPPELAAGRALFARGRAECLEANRLSFAASDSEIRTWAKRCAGEAGALIDAGPDELAAIATAINVCRRYGVETPKPADKMDLPACRRVASARWWRRRGRVLVARRVDHAARLAGEVRSRGHLYCADLTVQRWAETRSRNGELLESLTAINEAGDEYTLAELAELSTSNPELRRNELMTRVKGLEEISEVYGHRGLFITPTAPSEHHAVIERTNQKNPVFGGQTPRETQAWLTHGWAKVRALLWKRHKLKVYGFRSVEPHHDGTPHWHMLVFAPSRALQHVRKAFIDVFLDPAELPTDPQRRRDRLAAGVKFKTMRPEKGSAVGYVAKYIAKAVDGHQLQFTMSRAEDGSLQFTSADPATAAERIRAWASAWGIRQFQMFGTPAVALWRELRRHREPTDSQIIEAARKAADEGDYAMHVAACGGVLKPRKRCALAPLKEQDPDEETGVRLGIYGEPVAARTVGVEVNRWFLFPALTFPSLRGFIGDRAAELKAAGSSWAQARRVARAEKAAEVERRAAAEAEQARQRWEFTPAHVITRTHCWVIERKGGFSEPWTRVNNCNRAEATQGAEFSDFGFTSPPPAVSDRRPPPDFSARPPPK